MSKKPEDYLAPISGEIPLLLVIGVYVIALVLILQLFKQS